MQALPKVKDQQGKGCYIFQQIYDESHGKAWERFRHLLRQTLTHGFDEALQINMFLGGLRAQSELMLNASTDGKISLKTPREAIDIIENMVVVTSHFS